MFSDFFCRLLHVRRLFRFYQGRDRGYLGIDTEGKPGNVILYMEEAHYMPGSVIIVSYGELAVLIRRLTATIKTDVNIETIEDLHDSAVVVVKSCAAQNNFTVFLSSGGMYRTLSQHINNRLMEITVTGFDFLMAVKKASCIYKKLAVIHYTMMPFLDDILDVLAVPVKQVNLRDHRELERVLDDLKQEGIEAVIGGSLVCEKAKQIGLGGFLVYSTESVTRALDAAITVAQTRFAETQKAEELQAILDFSYEGIVAIDCNGLIKAVNPSAEKILGINRQQVLGLHIETTRPEIKLGRVLASRRAELNQVESIGGTRVIINRIPIVIKEEMTGALATLHDAGSIQKAEAKIRESMRQKNFRARVTFADIFGNSPGIVRAKEKASLYAKNDSAVLIHGESGTGKELFAQAIHNASRRARYPFVAINCAALPENLLESELFGHEEGAFTGARKGGKPGLFEIAHQGTIFLDEMSSMPIHLQAKLLRVIQEKEIMRVGADYVIPLDVRILSASNQDLRANIKAGTFRSDLFYRLSTLDITLPPLQERQEDIVPLFRHFARKILGGPDEVVINDRLSQAFHTYAWPGNIRELANAAEKFVILKDWNIDPADLLGTADFIRSVDSGKPIANLKSIGEGVQIRIVNALAREGVGRAEIAELLGISRAGLWKKMKRHENGRKES